MLTFSCFDKETTSVDVATTAVVQAAVVSAPGDDNGIDLAQAIAHSQLFKARDVPEASTRVHRITDRNPERFDFDVTVIPDDAPAFVDCAASMVEALTKPGVVAVSFNGCRFDVPILARFAARGLGLTPTAVEARLLASHVDVFRLWTRARTEVLPTPWHYRTGAAFCELCGHPDCAGCGPRLTSDMFAGTLTAAHGFWLGEGFDAAHDATVDCHATLRVLSAMLRERFVDVETAIRWSNSPLPGDVDLDGKFKWEGDRAVITFGKHAGTPLEDLPRSYVRWMLESDFGTSTKAMLVDFAAGRYPQRAYEDET